MQHVLFFKSMLIGVIVNFVLFCRNFVTPFFRSHSALLKRVRGSSHSNARSEIHQQGGCGSPLGGQIEIYKYCPIVGIVLKIMWRVFYSIFVTERGKTSDSFSAD